MSQGGPAAGQDVNASLFEALAIGRNPRGGQWRAARGFIEFNPEVDSCVAGQFHEDGKEAAAAGRFIRTWQNLGNDEQSRARRWLGSRNGGRHSDDNSRPAPGSARAGPYNSAQRTVSRCPVAPRVLSMPAFSSPEPLPTRPLTIAVEGPRATSASLAIVNDAFATALAAQPGVVVAADQPGEIATHTIRNMYPPVLDAGMPGVPTFFYFAWEDSRIPAAWARAFNRHFHGLLVPSTHVRDVVRRSGVVVPVAVVPYGVDAVIATKPEAPVSSPLTRKRFRFLHVSTGFPRKGCDVLIRAFVREFSSAEDVSLIIKTLPQYDHPTAWQVRRARWSRLRCPEIVHVDEDLDVAAMRQLYASASCLVHPARAEGFALPVAEAMLAGVPVIASNYSGHTDFCTDDTALLVPCRAEPSRSPFVVERAEWGEPDEQSLRRAMRYAFENIDEPAIRARVSNAAAHVGTFSWQRAATRAVSFIRTLDEPLGELIRAGMLTTWCERCGIAEYSRQLIDAVGAAVSWTMLAPYREEVGAAVLTDGETAGELPAIRCWRDQWPVDVSDAIAHVRRLDLQVVHVQTHLNTWTADTAEALVHLVHEGRRVFVTFHSVRGAQPDAALVRALASLDRLLVHTDGDRRLLADLGLDENVVVLPQGYPEVVDEEPAAARARLGLQGTPVIGTFGFLRPHKGLVELIQAFAHLRRRYPDAVLLAVTALYPSDDSAAYYERCLREATRLGLAEHCHFMTDFLDAGASLAALRACDVIALPYLPTIDSSSAAVRMALASRRPVVATDVPVFADVKDAVVTVRRRTPRRLAEGIASALEDSALRTRLADNAARLLNEESWEAVGSIYRKMLRAEVTDLSAFEAAYPIARSS